MTLENGLYAAAGPTENILMAKDAMETPISTEGNRGHKGFLFLRFLSSLL